MYFYKLYIGLLLVAFFCSCHKDTQITKPDLPTKCEFAPGNRNFTWRMDTVAWFPSWLGGVWAFSDTDAYLMGNIITNDNPSQGLLGMHWNGRVWERNLHGEDQEIKHYANDVTGDDNILVSVGLWSISNPKPGLAEFDNRTKKWKGYQFETAGELRAVWTDGTGFFIAVGDNGMVYTKDGYDAGWIYSKVNTNFSFTVVRGISKKEIYAIGQHIDSSGVGFSQVWKYTKNMLWQKIYDKRDTSNKLPIANDNFVVDIYPYYCSYSDTLSLFIIDDYGTILRSKRGESVFNTTNMTLTMGLPLIANGRSLNRIEFFNTNDYWILGTRFNFYHWNGNNFQKMILPGLPNDDKHFGIQMRMIKTRTGKIFFPTAVSSQVYVVMQGTP